MAKSVYDESTKTLTIYYDEVDHSGEGVITYYNISGNWGGDGAIKVVFDASMRDYRPTSCASWFYGYGSLTAVEGLNNLDTSMVTSFRRMFRAAGSIKTLDLSSFDTSRASDMREMFCQLRTLTTIYVSNTFVTNNVTASDDMFKMCFALTGGEGTVAYRSTSSAPEHPTDATSAHVDGGEEAPGYFTFKACTRLPRIIGVTARDISSSGAAIDVTGSDLLDGCVSVSLVTNETFVVDEIVTNGFGSVSFDGLSPETTYGIRVVATDLYGIVTNANCVFTTLIPAGESWLIDEADQSMSWGGWTFPITIDSSKRTVAVLSVRTCPDMVSPLDFSRPVVDGSGRSYVITTLSAGFGYSDSSNKGFPAGREPHCSRVGRLTLPGEGLGIMGNYSFTMCSNATGRILFPSSLTNIGVAGFMDCKGLTLPGNALPSGLKHINAYMFRNVQVEGDLDLSSLVSLDNAAFQGSSVGRVVFGSGLCGLGGNYRRGTFQDCTSLTNVFFHPESSFGCDYGYTFSGCTKLEEIDLAGITSLKTASGKSEYGHFAGCTSLKRITFGPKLNTITSNALANVVALREVRFSGPSPDKMDAPLYSCCGVSGPITTYVPYKYEKTTNGVGRCWRDYTTNGTLSNGTSSWAEDCRDVASALNRLLLGYGPRGFCIYLQ